MTERAGIQQKVSRMSVSLTIYPKDVLKFIMFAFISFMICIMPWILKDYPTYPKVNYTIKNPGHPKAMLKCIQQGKGY